MASKAFNINFMGQRKLAAIVSIALVVISIAALTARGLNLGLDFLGGTQLEVTYSESADLDQTRQVLQNQGFEDATVVHFGAETEVMIRFHGTMEEVASRGIRDAMNQVAPEATLAEVVTRRGQNYEAKAVIGNAQAVRDNLETVFPEDLYGAVRMEEAEGGATAFLLNTNLADAMTARLLQSLSEAAGSEVTLNYSESVDSQVGAEMFENAMIGMLVSLLIVMGYVALRFQYKFSVGAVAALGHDVIIVLGLFAIFAWDFDLTVFAALLAVIGYSLNDTIVVSDRIRENFRTIRKQGPVDIVNTSLNQTFGRTLVTSLTTLLVLFALFFFGGEVIHNFSLALILGVIIGTYSSIFVAANFLLALHITKEDLMLPVKEGAEFDENP